MGKGYRDNSNKTPNKLYHENGAGRSTCGKTRLQTANAGYTLGKDFTNCREVFYFSIKKEESAMK